MAIVDFPDNLLVVFREFRTCEFSTMAKDGTPITWPTAARFQPEQRRFVITTSIGLPQKAFNIRRNPRVALFFSDPTASGLTSPPAVLVQGDAEAPDTVVTSVEGLEEYWRENILGRQPAGMLYSRNALTRYLTDWYYMRILIHVKPRRIVWWPSGNMAAQPHVDEVANVG